MQKEKRLVPELRFPEFYEKWNRRKIGSLGSFYGGGTPDSTKKSYWNGNIPWISSSDIIDESIHVIRKTRFITEKAIKQSATKLIPQGSVLMVSRVGIGKFAIADEDLCTSQDFTNLICNENAFFTAYYFKARSNRFLRLSQGTSIKGFTTKDIKAAIFYYPIEGEQKEIAKFLTAIDTRLQSLEKNKSLLEQYKKGVMQQIFKQKIRFKDDNDEVFPKWRRCQLSEIANRVKTKNKIDNQNVLTISAQLGLISQLEYFNKSVSAKNLTGYYLLEKNDFAYNKSYSNGYPMGAIKRLNRYDYGVVSTLYICFRFNENVSLDFMEQYFESGLQNREVEKVAQEGARNHGLLNIGVNDFFEIDLKIPCLKEQTKIANFLSAIDKKIGLVGEQIEKTKVYKKGLLQQMFV